MTNESVHTTLPQQNLAFLRLVAHDDQFRQQLQANPATVLAKFGLSTSDVPQRVTLPGKDVLQSSLQHLAGDDEASIYTMYHMGYFVQ